LIGAAHDLHIRLALILLFGTAVHLVSAGIAIEKGAQYLGHPNTAVTYRVYGRYRPQHMQDAAEVLDCMRLQDHS
jgi:hypothetical protein